MKHLKNSLIVFAAVIAITAIVTVFIPTHTKGGSNDVPKTAFSIGTFVVTNSTLSGPDPEGTDYAITSSTVTNGTPETRTAQFAVIRGASSNCQNATSITAGPIVQIPPGETVHLSFPQPFVFPAESPGLSCLIITGMQSAIGANSVTVVGYKF